MNKFRKYCPNVWVAECEEAYKKGETIFLETKNGKMVECEVYNLLFEKNEKFFYSIVRIEEKSYAERKVEKYLNSAANNSFKSREYYKKSKEGNEFLSLGEPIKVGHHSEKRHRKLLEKNWRRMEKSNEFKEKEIEANRKAEYWETKAKKITLAMPESLEYYKVKLKEAITYQKGLKEGTIPREHSYSLAYATKNVKEIKKKLEKAEILWG